MAPIFAATTLPLPVSRSPPSALATLAESPPVEVDHQTLAGEGQLGIVAGPLVPHEGVGAVPFVPREVNARFAQAALDESASLGGDVGVLPSPDHQHLALDLAGAGQAVVASAAQAALVDVGGVEAC